MIEKITLAKVKSSLEHNLGRKVRLVSKKGRKKSVERQGFIEAIYPSIFIVKLCDDQNAENDGRMVSYSYTDVLTKTVRLALCQTESLDA